MRTLFTCLLVSISLISFSSAKPDHSIWDRYVGRYAGTDGNVNYTSMKLDMDTLDAYLLQVREKGPQTDWSNDEKIAYFLNAYNAYTIKFILSKLPVTNIKDVSFSGKDLWNFRMANLGGTNYTLQQIETDFLRKMGEPRIHFAMCKAYESSPKLYNQAFVADKLNSQLTAVTKAFINDPKCNVIGEKKLQLSEIFQTYSTDFTSGGKTIIEFLNQYSNITIMANAKIEYMIPDWSLND